MIWGMIGVIIDHYGGSLIMRRVFLQADDRKDESDMYIRSSPQSAPASDSGM